VADGVSLVLEYRVIGGPTWHLAVADGTIRVATGSAEAPDMSFHAEWATALAMADGSLDPLQAVIDGDLLLHGDPRSLVTARDLLDDVGDLFSNC
jgi:predicted lipid carrier protein YhbT